LDTILVAGKNPDIGISGLFYIDARLMTIFQDNLGKLVPECLLSGFYWNQGGSDN